MGNLRYLLQETLAGLCRAKVSFFLSVLTVGFLLILMGLLFLFSQNADRILASMNAEFEMQVFISPLSNDAEISALGRRLQNIPGIEAVMFYSKDAAAEEFKREFGDEIFQALEENPLPSSFNVRCDARHSDAEQVKVLVTQIESYPGVDEVIYQNEMVSTLSRYSRVVQTANWVLLLFVVLGSLLVISNTVRLVILGRQQIIETMRLVGATSWLIRLPYLLQGLLQGALGGGAAFLLLAVVVRFVQAQAPGVLITSKNTLLLAVLVGAGLGVFASVLSVRRFLKT